LRRVRRHLLGVMEVSSISLVFQLCGLGVVLESAEVLFAELLLSVSLETLVQRWLLALVILRVDG